MLASQFRLPSSHPNTPSGPASAYRPTQALPQRGMPGFFQSLAEWLGFEPAPGTPEHREALCRAVKAKNDEQAKPAGKRDEAKLLELRKRVVRLTIQTVQVGGALYSPRVQSCRRRCRRRPPRAPYGAGWAASPLAAPAALSSPHGTATATLQAQQQWCRYNAGLLLQRPDWGCCPDCPRVNRRHAASLQAMAAWHEQWELVLNLWLQALEQGHPYPPLKLPYLEVQPFLPEGLPEDLPPTIDRCAACHSRLEQVRAGGLQALRLCSRHLDHSSGSA